MRRLSLGNAASVRDLIHASIKSSGEQRYLHRLHCVLLVAEGRSCYEVARWFGEDARTIERWVHALDEQGVKGLRGRHSGGRPRKLAGDQVERLMFDLQKPPRMHGYAQLRWSGKGLAQHLIDTFGIKLSARQCQRVIRSLGKGGRPRAG